MGAPVRAPSTHGSPARRRDWSFWLLMAGIAVMSFGIGWVIDWHRPVAAVTLVVVGAVLAVAMRVRRNRADLHP